MTPTTQPAEHTKLLPCPFCGEQPNSRLFQDADEDGNVYYSYHEIGCENRECEMMPLVNVNLEEQEGDNPWEQAIEKAIAAWNRRAGIPAQESAIEQAREALRAVIGNEDRTLGHDVLVHCTELEACRAALAALSAITPASDKQG